MKIKTSVTISSDLIATIDKLLDDSQNRSSFLEAAAWEHISRIRRAKSDQRDLEIINQNAEQLNNEAIDALSYQAPI